MRSAAGRARITGLAASTGAYLKRLDVPRRSLAAGPQGGLLAKRIIYFDFDSSDIKSEYNDMITAHARYLAANTGKRVRVEGNTDERGSREYNIGLGERRAQAVRRALMLQGVSESLP